jgi:hypothetical protein
VPAGVLCGLPTDLGALTQELGVASSQFQHMRHGALQAELDVPAGIWRIWPELGLALWVGRNPKATMPFISAPRRAAIDLHQALLRLHSSGLWLQEGRVVLDDGSLTGPLPLETIVAALREQKERIAGIAGFWGDENGRALEAEIHRTGELRACHPAQALRWLLTAHGLNA